MSESIGSDYPKEQERLIALLLEYARLGVVGQFGVLVISNTLARSCRAMASGDITELLAAYAAMKGCS